MGWQPVYTRPMYPVPIVLLRKLDAGMLFINRYGCYGLAAPFGGFKQSGWGKEMAIHSLSSYTKTKGVWVHFGE